MFVLYALKFTAADSFAPQKNTLNIFVIDLVCSGYLHYKWFFFDSQIVNNIGNHAIFLICLWNSYKYQEYRYFVNKY